MTSTAAAPDPGSGAADPALMGGGDGTNPTHADENEADPAHADGKGVDPTHVAAVLRAVEASQPRCGGVRVLAIDGPSGAGKSVLALAVAEALGAPLVQTDDLTPGWDGLAQAAPLLTEQVLRPLAGGRTAAYRRWDWHASDWAELIPVEVASAPREQQVGTTPDQEGAGPSQAPADPGQATVHLSPSSTDATASSATASAAGAPTRPGVLVVEGCGCSARPAGDYAAVRVWVEAPRDVRYARGIARDGETYSPHWTRWQRQEDALFSSDGTRERADLVLRTA